MHVDVHVVVYWYALYMCVCVHCPGAQGPGAEEVSTTLRCPGCARGGYKSIASVPGGVPAPPPWGFLPTHIIVKEPMISVGGPPRRVSTPGYRSACVVRIVAGR